MTHHDRLSRLRRTAGVVVAGLGLLGVMAIPAGAQGYVPAPNITTDDSVVQPGATVPIESEGFLPNADVDLFITDFRPIPDNGKSDEENLEDLSDLVDIPFVPLNFAASPASSGDTEAAFAVATAPATPATFAAITTVAIPLGSTTTDANGRFRFEWSTAGFPEGFYGILATDGVNSALVRVQVDQAAYDAANGGAGAGGGSGSLPTTGGVNQVPLRIGVLLLAAGGVAVLFSRRRRANGFTVSG
jgi:LPXTG-motif cell wall-anchored protein